MKTIFVDSEFHCHTNNPDGIYTEVETDFFDGKCQEFVEGYCCDDSNGYRHIYPWKSSSELETAQREYERQKMKEYEEALKVVGVTV